MMIRMGKEGLFMSVMDWDVILRKSKLLLVASELGLEFVDRVRFDVICPLMVGITGAAGGLRTPRKRSDAICNVMSTPRID
jgi:hypothetical protein